MEFVRGRVCVRISMLMFVLCGIGSDNAQHPVYNARQRAHNVIPVRDVMLQQDINVFLWTVAVAETPAKSVILTVTNARRKSAATSVRA